MSNLPTLYKLADEYLAAAERMADLDLPPEVIADTLEGLSGEVEAKATNVAAFVRNLEANAAAIKEAEAQMAARRKAIEARAQHIRDYLRDQMQRTGIKSIESPWFKVALRENPPAVVIADEASIPPEFLRVPPPPPATPDKTAIAAVLKAGGEVPGAFLARSTRVEIK